MSERTARVFEFATRFLVGTAVGLLVTMLLYYSSQHHVEILDVSGSEDSVRFFGLRLGTILSIGLIIPLVFGIAFVLLVRRRYSAKTLAVSIVVNLAGLYCNWLLARELVWLCWYLAVD